MKKNLVLLVLLAYTTNPLFAWDAKGHVIVAEIARKYLNAGVEDSVQKYLKQTTFAEAATWMDDVRGEQSYNYMYPWHFVNVEKDKTFVRNNEANAFNELETVISELFKRHQHNAKETGTNLKILFHLTGDLHQPLHAGYGSDKGGNVVSVSLLGRMTNLHHVWDTDLAEAKGITLEDCLKLAAVLTPEEIKQIRQEEVMAWMNESRALLPEAYNIKDGTLGREYVNRNAPVVLRRLVWAGLRLSGVLNRVFSK
jgi:hypothetical protein